MANKAVGLLTFNFGANLQGFERAMNKAQKKLKTFGRNVEKTGKNLTLGLTLPLGALGIQAIKTTATLEETRRKFDTVFSGISDSAERAAVKFAESMRMSELETKTLLSNTADLLVGFGFTEEAALKLSLQVNELAVDLAAFNPQVENAAQASEALTKGLLGERESMKTLGIAIKESDLKQFAEQQGLIWKETDRATRAQLTYELAMQQTTKAQGAHVANMDTFAGMLKIMKSQFDEAAVSIGEKLLPHVKSFASWITKLLKRFENLSPETQDFIIKAGLLAVALGPVLIVIGRISTGLSSMIRLVKTTTTVIGGMSKGWLGVIGVVGTAIFSFRKWGKKSKETKEEIDNVSSALANAEASIAGQIGNIEQLTSVISDENTSLDNKIIALKELQEISPEYYGHLELSKTIIEDLTIANDNYIASLRRKAKMEAFSSKIVELEQKKIKQLENLYATIGLEFGDEEGLQDFMNQYLADLTRPDFMKQIDPMLGLEVMDIQGNIAGLDEQINNLVGLLLKLKTETPQTKRKLEEFGDGVKFVEGEFVKLSALAPKVLEIPEKLSKIPSPFSKEELDRISFFNLELMKNEILMTALTDAGWKMFGDVLTSSLDSALSSQENFFDVFIENIKKAIRQLLIQLAVMTLIKALMGGGAAAFSLANLKANLATIMGVQLAEGGLATGPTAALVGEGPNTSISNPEVIAPLDKLKQYMGGGNVEVTGVIRGNDIYLSNEKTRFNRSRTV